MASEPGLYIARNENNFSLLVEQHKNFKIYKF